jgi:hypothetical protein
MENFKPRKMVGWFDINQLAGTAIRAILSSVFGSYADKRETIASISKVEFYDANREGGEFWLDYMADTGDGFDATFTMMKLIAADHIIVHSNEESKFLPRAKVVIFGGDQVYPTPSRELYQDRFIGPLKAAALYEEGDKQSDLYVVPGNHDWYDGLTNFVKIFCNKRSIGSFQTRQNRSYFAIRLTDNTWLWAIDIQLEADIDGPQLNYFDEVATGEMQKGDKVILCTAEPSWVYNTSKRVDTSYINLEYFEKECILEKGLEQILTLAGDLHHYARYSQLTENGGEKHKITSGGGGAFMHPTHNLPETLINMNDGDYELKKTFPSKKASRRMAFGNVFFPLRNRSFGFFLAAINLFLGWAMRISSSFDTIAVDILDQLKNFKGVEIQGNYFDKFQTVNLSDIEIVQSRIFNTFTNSIPAMFILLIFAYGFYKFCDTNSSKLKYMGAAGLIHGILHIMLMLFSLGIFTYFNYSILDITGNLSSTIMVSLETFFIGGFLSGLLMGVYLMFCNLLFGIHDNETFSALKIEGNKNFLRMHFKDNILTIYAVGLKKIARWKVDKDCFKTDDVISPILIEDPIVIDLKSSSL